MAPIISSADISQYKGLQTFVDYIKKPYNHGRTPDAFDFNGDGKPDTFTKDPKTNMYETQKGQFGDNEKNYFLSSDGFCVLKYSDSTAAIKKIDNGFEYYIDGKHYYAIKPNTAFLGSAVSDYLIGKEDLLQPGVRVASELKLGTDGNITQGSAIGSDGMLNLDDKRKAMPLSNGNTIVCDLSDDKKSVANFRVYNARGEIIQGSAPKAPAANEPDQKAAKNTPSTLHQKLMTWMTDNKVTLKNAGGTVPEDITIPVAGTDKALVISKDTPIGQDGWGSMGIKGNNGHDLYFALMTDGNVIVKSVDPSTKQTSAFTIYSPRQNSDGTKVFVASKSNADIAPTSTTKGSRTSPGGTSKTSASSGSLLPAFRKSVLASNPVVKGARTLDTDFKSGETVIVPAGTKFDASGWADVGGKKVAILKDGAVIVATVDPNNAANWREYTLYNADGTVKETKKASGGTDAPVTPGTNPVVTTTTTTGGSQLVTHTGTDDDSGGSGGNGGSNNTLLIGAGFGLFLLLRNQQKRKQAAAQQQWAFQQQAMMAQQGSGGDGGFATPGVSTTLGGMPQYPQFQPSFLPPGSQVNQQQTMFA